MSVFRPTCRPTKFDADLCADVLIPQAVNYLRQHPVESLDADTREVLRRELAGWLADHSRMADTLQGEDLQQYKARAAEVLAKVNRALGCLDGCRDTEDLRAGEVDRSSDTAYRESIGITPRTLAS